jgi:isopentenyl phosphate kinase
MLDAEISGIGVDPAVIFNEQFSSLSGPMAHSHLLNLTKNGVIPVVYGDMISDSNGQFNVLSSDVIACILAKELDAQHLIFLSNVPGVMKPAGPNAEESSYLQILSESEITIASLFGDSDKHDVSGGMRAKMKYALEASRLCEACWIGSANTQGILSKFFLDGTITGTQIISKQQG